MKDQAFPSLKVVTEDSVTPRTGLNAEKANLANTTVYLICNIKQTI